MSKVSGVIQINGTTYDAATGNVIGAARKVAHQVKTQSRVIDGFIKKSGSAVPKVAKASVERLSARSEFSRANRQDKPAQTIHARAQRSKALVRSAVIRPKDGPKLHINDVEVNNIDKEKLSRASAIAKDARVKRFGALRPAKAIHKQIVTAKARPMDQASTDSARAATTVMPSMVASASHQRLERMLDQALVQADAHKQRLKQARNPLYKLSRAKRILVVTMIALIFLVVAALIVWQDMPQVAIRIAGKRAHIAASMPAYTPSGFSFVKAQSVSNAVQLKYEAKQESGASYSLTQQKSVWDSSSLAANTISASDAVQTSQVQGTTVYIYGHSNDATWVNNGIRYTIDNQAKLSSDQILQIVQSM